VAIYGLLQNSGFTPEQVQQMSEAYERALVTLGLSNRSDPLTLLIAKSIIDVAQTGETDPTRICTLALAQVGGQDTRSKANLDQ
jgi:hypothetical protein